MLVILVCWGIWTNRNGYKFNSRSFTPQEAIIPFFDLLRQYEQFNTVPARSSQIPIISSWKPPRQGRIKLNTDAGEQGSGKWQFGVVFITVEGRILLVVSTKVQGAYKPQIVEALVVCWALELVIFHGIQGLEAESDCKRLVDAFHSNSRI